MAAKKTQSPTPGKSDPPHGAGLRGKVAVITGGSRGIGFAIARALAGERCDVVITSRNAAELERRAAELRNEVHDGATIVPIPCDVRRPESVGALFQSVGQRFGKVDVLVNNAGISQPATPLEETTLELWQAVMETNLTSVFLCSRAALPLMQAGGTIINNLSAAAKQLFPQYYAYTAAKTGALGFTLSLREELKPRGIRVTALLPGATNTDIWQQIMPDAPREGMIDVESIAQAVLYAVLLPAKVNLSEISLDPAAGAV